MLKFANIDTLQTFLDNLKNVFALLGHKHAVSDVTDLDVATWDNDGLLSTTDKMQLDYGGIKTISYVFY